MVRANAFSIITFMANKHAFRDIAIVDAVRNSVRSFLHTLFFGIPYDPVPIPLTLTRPFPAVSMWALALGFVYLVVKAFLDGDLWASVGLVLTGPRAILSGLGASGFERVSANKTGSCYGLVSHDFLLVRKLWLDPFGCSQHSLGSFSILAQESFL